MLLEEKGTATKWNEVCGLCASMLEDCFGIQEGYEEQITLLLREKTN